MIGFSILLLFAFKDNDYKIIKSLDIFYAVFNEVVEHYADENDPEKLIHTAIDAMLSSLDPYTIYFREDENKIVKLIHTGNYVGVGATIMQIENKTYIDELLENCPAQKYGLKNGDRIIAIDTTNLKNHSIHEISTLMIGEPNTYVNLTFERNGIVNTIRIKRENIKVPNVSFYGLISDSIGYIRLSSFTTNACNEVKHAVKEIEKREHVSGIIIDLRNNPGGLLNEAIDIVNLFIDKDQTIVTLKKRNVVKVNEYKTSHYPLDTSTPLVVILNNESASASEIVSGSLQDLDRAVIIGQRSFGKGLVQTELKMPNNSYLNLTTSKYYIPSGRCIQSVDYFHKQHDGSSIHIADTLKNTFFTKNKRIVYDCGGITPDIYIAEDTLNDFVNDIFTKNIIFKFVNLYELNHKSIPLPRYFIKNDSVFSNFENFVINLNYHYLSPPERKLNQFEEELRRYNNTINFNIALNEIKSGLQTNVKQLLNNNKEIIDRVIKLEICKRYYYSKDNIEAEINNDKEVVEAVKLFNDKTRYFKILKSESETH